MGQQSRRDASGASKVAKRTSNKAVPSEFALEKLQFIDVRPIGKRLNKDNSKPTRVLNGSPITVASWNILSEEYIINSFYAVSPPVSLTWNHRKARFLEHAAEVDVDILCLQELDHYNDFWRPEMLKLGYKSLYEKRDGDRSDGCGIFWKESKFDFVNYLRVEMNDLVNFPFDSNPERYDKGCVGLILILQPKGENEESQICVATTHIFWNPKYEDVKIRQALLLLHKIEEFWQRKDRLIVCGDFNSTPDSAMYQLMRSGSIDVTEWDGDLGGRGFGKPQAGSGRKLCDLASFDMKAKIAGMTDAEKAQYKHVFSKLDKVYRKLFMEMATPVLRHPFRFESAYQLYNMYTDENVNTVDERVVERWAREAQEGRGEPVTSFFSRFRGCIDYIFISSDCQTTQYVQLPGKLALDAMRGLPTLTWPSDHLLVGAELQFFTERDE